MKKTVRTPHSAITAWLYGQLLSIDSPWPSRNPKLVRYNRTYKCCPGKLFFIHPTSLVCGVTVLLRDFAGKNKKLGYRESTHNSEPILFFYTRICLFVKINQGLFRNQPYIYFAFFSSLACINQKHKKCMLQCSHVDAPLNGYCWGELWHRLRQWVARGGELTTVSWQAWYTE